MKQSFPGYYQPTEGEFALLWENGLFVPDASVLLDIYRYSKKTRDGLFKAFGLVSEQLWIPHQAALEFQKNRANVIEGQKDIYDKIDRSLKDTLNKIENGLRQYRRSVPVDRWLGRLSKAFKPIMAELRAREKGHPNLLRSDRLRDRLLKWDRETPWMEASSDK